MADRAIDVSKPTKRAVRQRCGFGCIFCGLPIYEYDHMRGYSEQTADVPEEITLLCPNHHADKTRGRLALETVLLANEQAFNMRTGVSSPYGLHYHGDTCEIRISQNQFVGVGQALTALLMRDEKVISFDFADEGQLLLNANIRNRSGEQVLLIEENEMVYSASQWDIEYVAQVLIVRQAQGDILFELQFQPPSRIDLTRAKLAYDDVTVTVDSAGFHVVGPSPRERDVKGFKTYGIKCAMALDCEDIPPGTGLVL
jgi:hypothetical protein